MDRDAAIVADYERLGSAEKAAKQNRVSKKTALRVLARAGVERRDRGQEKAERLERVRELEEAGVPRTEMPERLGISQSQLYLDLHELGYPERRPRKHPPAEPRECAHPECSVVFTPAADLMARGGGRYCSPLCARRSPASREWAREGMASMHEEADRELARLNADGYLSMRQAAKEVRVAETTLHRYVELDLLKTEPKRLVSGEWLRLLRRDELERFKREEGAELQARHTDMRRHDKERGWPDYPKTWHSETVRRHKNRVNGLDGGSPVVVVPAETRAEIWRLKDLGHGRRVIPLKLREARVTRNGKPARVTENVVRRVLVEPRPA